EIVSVDDDRAAPVPHHGCMTTSITTTTAVAARAVTATKIYGTGDAAVRALDAVSLELPDGRFTAIMGPSGSGKSTLLHCLAGLDHLTDGHVFVGDVELGSLSDTHLTRLRRDRIGFVFQSYNLVPTLTAAENITLPMLLAGRKPDRRFLDDVIATVGLADRLSHRPSELSGGQQQRVPVAPALASQRRLAGTVLAVFLGVAFLAGTLALSDTLRANFADLFAAANSHTDVVVRSATELSAAGGQGPDVRQRGSLDSSVADRVRAVDGVAVVLPSIEGYGP